MYFLYDFTSSGQSIYQLSLCYFDHLLQKQMIAVVTCRNPTTANHLASPVMICRNKDVTVKLLPGTRMQSVKVPGETTVIRKLLMSGTPNEENLHFIKSVRMFNQIFNIW
ncbi:hypothetical protein CHARACLAT_017811 [Characodon lateralis]|uniref:Uncharacterized protein n=1 Tax=Characodon lateralis TaxID=208331 RepID=A0ABU7F3U8_9TELE|nr:hypothetical protein [Characodon lateralis]